MKFAFVTPRYGADIGAGPEHACRLLAEHVGERHAVEVLTTCSSDARSWKSDYPEGAERVRGVLVRRFAVSQPADRHRDAGLATAATLGVRASDLEWVHARGPWSPGLIDYLSHQHRSYDALVFFSLANPLTVHGVRIAPGRTVLFPYLVLSSDLRRGIWRDVAASVNAIGFFSETERHLLRHYLRVEGPREELVGIGVDPPPRQTYPRHQQNPADTYRPDAEQEEEEDAAAAEEPTYLSGRGIPFRRRNRLYGRLAFYGGRVEPDNGCEELLEYFDAYAETDDETALVLMGVKMMSVPGGPYLQMPGVLPDRERMVAYEAVDVVMAPVPDDLLAQPVLESFAVGTPVLACGRNAAAVEHCRRANGGLYYGSRGEFVEALRVILHDNRVHDSLGANGRDYVRQQFRWDAVIGRFERLSGVLRP